MEVFVSKRVTVPVTLFLALATAAAGSAQQVSDAEVKELTRLAMQQAQAGQTGAGPTVELKVDDAVERAMSNNLTIAAQRLTPRTYDYSISALTSAYLPTFTSSLNNQNSTRLPTNQFSGGRIVSTKSQGWTSGLSQAVRWGGGSFNVAFNNGRSNSNAQNNTFNPAYTSNLTATYTQPLLRNFKIDSTRASIDTTKISRSVAEQGLQSTIATTEANVRDAYWDLVAAVRAVAVARQSLSLATKLVEDNRQRVEIGTMAPLDVVQAQSEEASRRQILVQAQATRRTAELALKQLIVSGTSDPLWNATITPVDQPIFAPQPIDIEASVRQALDQRIDLQQAREQLESNNISLKNLSNQTLPQLDLQATYQLAGRGGTSIQYDQAIGGQRIGTIPGGYIDALKNIANWDAPTWNVGVNLSYPLGQSAARANAARARIQLEQSQTQLKQLQLQVATEVTNLALQVSSNAESVQAAAAARELAQKQLDAEESKFEVGLSTNYMVVQAQRDLANAQVTELQANTAYQKSLVNFHRALITGSSSNVTSISSGGGGGGTASRPGGN
jgi:outer membrane protein TolC